MRTYRHHPILGTVIDVAVEFAADTGADADPADTEADVEADTGADVDERCDRVDAAVVDEMVRLESVFSVYDDGSELSRWKRGDIETVGPGSCPELAIVLAEALAWQERSGGAFNVAARAVQDLWRDAERRGRAPSTRERAAVAAAVSRAPYVVEADGRIIRVGDVVGVDLNAFAKGWIVDRAVERALVVAATIGVDPADLDLTVSAGGDVRHHGARPVTVGIENPLRPYDNEPPLTSIRLGAGGLATSGRARRGFRVGGEWFGHVIDPRTATPIDAIASISVVAPDAASADVIATVAGVETAARAPDIAEGYGAACLVVTADGERVANGRWRAISAG